jgi:hypothetical protein
MEDSLSGEDMFLLETLSRCPHMVEGRSAKRSKQLLKHLFSGYCPFTKAASS